MTQNNDEIKKKIREILNITINEQGVDCGEVGNIQIRAGKEKATEKLSTLFTEMVEGEREEAVRGFMEIMEDEGKFSLYYKDLDGNKTILELLKKAEEYLDFLEKGEK